MSQTTVYVLRNWWVLLMLHCVKKHTGTKKYLVLEAHSQSEN